MTKNIVIISTYPEHGSRNIGDQLITDSLSAIIKEQCDAKITTVWRAEAWQKVSDVISKADHIFFACLAIRPDMEELIYPYLSKVLESGRPFSVIAAGTDLPVHQKGDIYAGFSKKPKIF